MMRESEKSSQSSLLEGPWLRTLASPPPPSGLHVLSKYPVAAKLE